MKYARATIAALMFLCVLAVFPLSESPARDIKVLLFHWGALLLCSLCLVDSLLRAKRTKRYKIFFWCMLAFLAINFISSLNSSYPGNSLVQASALYSFFIIYAAASRAYQSTEQFRSLLTAICVAMGLASVYGLLQRFGLDPFPWAETSSDLYKNMPATFGNPNFAAHALVPSIIFAVYLATQKGTRWCIALALLFIVHLYLTYCRAGLLALFAAGVLGVVAIAVAKSKKKPSRSAAITMATIAILAVAGLAATLSFSKLHTGRLFPVDASTLLRYNSFNSASRMIAERPLLGYGPGNYVIENAAYWTPHEQEWFILHRLINAHVHNEVLEVATDAGLAAAALYLLALVLGGYYALYLFFSHGDNKVRSISLAMACFFLAFFTDGLLGFNFHTPVAALLLFIVLGAFEGVYGRLVPRKPQKETGRTGPVACLMVAAFVAIFSTTFASRIFISRFYMYFAQGSAANESYEDSILLAQAGLSYAPWNWNFPYIEGIAEMRMGNYPAASRRFETTVELNPNFVLGWFYLSEANYKLGISEVQLDSALRDSIRSARKAEALCPDMPEVQELLGRAIFKMAYILKSDKAAQSIVQDALAEADRHLTRSIELGANSRQELNSMLVTVRTWLKDRKGAQSALEIMASDIPIRDEAWILFDEFSATFNSYEIYIDTLSRQIKHLKTLDLPGNNALAATCLRSAEVNLKVGDKEGAFEGYLLALQVMPMNDGIWAKLAVLGQEPGLQNQFKDTLLAQRQKLAVSGAQPAPPMEAVAMAYEKGPQALPAATSMLLKMVHANQDDPKLINKVGWAIDTLIAEVAKQPVDTPETGPAFLNLALTLETLGKNEMAMFAFSAAAPRLEQKQRVQCVMNHAALLTRLSRYSEAEKIMLNAKKDGKGDLTFSLAFAGILTRNNKTNEAAAEYRRILDTFPLDENNSQLVKTSIKNLAK